ncbi:MAG: YidC/Oxa1 family membrane protein insertase [Eubacteriales bacterium]
MDIFLKFTGKLLEIIYNYVPNYGICILILALLSKLIFMAIGGRYYNSIKLVDALTPLVERNNKKYAGNPTKRGEELTKIFATNKYPIFGGISNFLSQTIFSLGLIGLFNHPELYLSNVTAEKLHFLFLDLTIRPIKNLYSPVGIETDLLSAAILIVLTLGLITIHDKVMEKKSLIDNLIFNKITWVILGICFLSFNQAFTLYWTSMKTMDLIHIFIVKKYFSVQMLKKEKTC